MIFGPWYDTEFYVDRGLDITRMMPVAPRPRTRHWYREVGLFLPFP